MSLTLQVVNLVIAGVSTFSCLKVSGMYMNEYDEGENKNIKTDVTGYIQIVTVAMFVMSMITTILLTWASIIELRAISNLMHLINPKFVKDNEKRMVTIPDTLSDHAFAQLNTKYKA